MISAWSSTEKMEEKKEGFSQTLKDYFYNVFIKHSPDISELVSLLDEKWEEISFTEGKEQMTRFELISFT